MTPNSADQSAAGDSPSFDNLMERLREKDPEASRLVFNRYVHRLVGLARKRLDPKVLRKEDPEDVIQSVFRSFFQRYQDGGIDLENWESVWARLALITSRKCIGRARFYHAECRDVGREQRAAGSANQSGSGWDFGSGDPTPEEEVILDETIQQLLASLPDPRHRRIVQLTLEGVPALAISAQIPCTERMVHRVLERSREWLAQHGREQEP